MSTETLPIAEASTPPVPAELLEIVASSGLTGDGVLTVQTAFCPFFVQASEWRQKIATVTDPKVARESRLMLRKVRVERLQDISEADAIAEGLAPEDAYLDGDHIGVVSAREQYEGLWEHIDGIGSWAANPWVWVLEFRRL